MDETLFYTFLNSSITRIGAILLIIFGVQILINLYRYNMRMHAYYNAIADAIELHETDGNTEKLSDLVETLSTKDIDFGKKVESPTKDIIEMAKTIADFKTGTG
ncbi:MAG: hypothetical protein COB88_07940 [Flavobacteriales bacterium]|nr:MAG: hypothetical protein COB88_07940 [Flavobacteriales bacterium]